MMNSDILQRNNNQGAQVIKHTQTVIDSRTTAKPFRHFGVSPVSEMDETDDDGEMLTFRFISSKKFDNGTNPLPFIEQQNQLSATVKLSHPYGIILQSKEKSAVYPVIQLCYGNDIVTAKDENCLVQGYESKSCVYKKLRQIDEFGPEIGYRQNIYYIILGFKTTDIKFNLALVDSWKDWTGARYIYINFPGNLDLKQLSLYHKRTTDDLNLFSYIVVVKCNGVDTKEKLTTLLDFVQRLRAERTSNFISVYNEAIM